MSFRRPNRFSSHGYVSEMSNAVGALDADRAPQSGPLMAWDTMAVLMAAYESSQREGAFVDLTEFREGRELSPEELPDPRRFGAVFQRVPTCGLASGEIGRAWSNGGGRLRVRGLAGDHLLRRDASQEPGAGDLPFYRRRPLLEQEQTALHNIVLMSEYRMDELMRRRTQFLSFQPPVSLQNFEGKLPPSGYLLVTEPDSEEVVDSVRLDELFDLPLERLEHYAEPVAIVPWCTVPRPPATPTGSDPRRSSAQAWRAPPGSSSTAGRLTASARPGR